MPGEQGPRVPPAWQHCCDARFPMSHIDPGTHCVPSALAIRQTLQPSALFTHPACALPRVALPQALLSGATYAPPALPANSMASAMFSLAWPKHRAPSSVGSTQVTAFTAAVKKFLPGAVMHVTRHISECTCTSSCRRSQQARRRDVLAAAMASSHYPSSCPGRAVFNVVVASPNRAQLAKLVQLAETQPGAVWPLGKVRQQGLRREFEPVSCLLGLGMEGLPRVPGSLHSTIAPGGAFASHATHLLGSFHCPPPPRSLESWRRRGCVTSAWCPPRATKCHKAASLRPLGHLLCRPRRQRRRRPLSCPSPWWPRLKPSALPALL